MKSLAGFLVAVTATLSGPQPARGEPVSPQGGCEALATLINTECEVEIVSICAPFPSDWRVYERYREGALISRVVREDGVFQRFFYNDRISRKLEFPIGILSGLLADSEGTEHAHEFSALIWSATGTKATTGTLIVRHLGLEQLDLASGPVEVLRLEADGEVSDGMEFRSIRLLDLELRVMLDFESTVTYPGRPGRQFARQTLWRLLPGDPGFGEKRPLPGLACGPMS